MTPRFSQLSPGGQLILRQLRHRPTVLLGRLGPLLASVDGLEKFGLVERCAPGRSPARNAIRITPAGRQLVEKEQP